jgi:triphosphoribosyl-dephospho-CoA synthase
MSVPDFVTSAHVSALPLTDASLPVGRRILNAVQATRTAVGTNTNLGILLLCAPVARAAETPTTDLRLAVSGVLDSLTMDDTAAVFKAIAAANPGGLGSGGENDVREPPRIGLLDAMREAADRDRVAYQYASRYADIFEIGLRALQAADAKGESGMWPAIDAYLAFLSAFPDSHIARKFGTSLAEAVRDEAVAMRSRLSHSSEEEPRLRGLLEFDGSLKQRGINPGTSADLTVCSLFVHRLMERLA